MPSPKDKNKRKIWIQKIKEAKKHQVFTESTRKKLSKSLTGRIVSARTREKIRKSLLGHPVSDETKLKMLNNRKKIIRGSEHYNWKGGITPINRVIRNSVEYKLWREAVFKRDDYTCRFCGVRGGIIHADHIKRFSEFPELRFALDNGRTLCVNCHRTTETWGNRK